jgi:hypothetical protein
MCVDSLSIDLKPDILNAWQCTGAWPMDVSKMLKRMTKENANAERILSQKENDTLTQQVCLMVYQALRRDKSIEVMGKSDMILLKAKYV